jgi:L,D-peptidoglycan transpeptidase YkuD (ErfK/YbiS/YcfS/YnhG family)
MRASGGPRGRSRHPGRIRRTLTVLVLLGAAGAVLTGPLPSPDLRETAQVAADEAAAVITLPASGTDLSRLRPAVPLGYATAEQRARAAAEQAAADGAFLAARAEEQARVEAQQRAEQEARAAAQAAAARPQARPSASASPSAAAPGPALPLGVDPAGSSQVVTVVAPSAGSTTATLTAWERGTGGWTAVLGPVPARVGAAGVGRASETTSRTPAGTFSLTEAFGRLGDPGTALPYRVIDAADWWVSDVGSPLYNQPARCAAGTCPFDESAGENLWAQGASYGHAVVIDYNRGGTPGAGSAFFLHVSNGAATAGCVAIDGGSLARLLRWLDPAAAPVIAIGVG